jgi:hypothetical protein
MNGTPGTFRKMCATCLTWHRTCEPVQNNMKYWFLDGCFMKNMFLIGARFALFWGGRHQDLPSAQP